MVTRCFTFGFSHAFPNGFIKITAESREACRETMFRDFNDKWAFDYSEEEIERQLKMFPRMYEVK